MELTTRERELFEKIDFQRIPCHVAIIMDGNGRWARKRGLPRVAGHRAGVNSLKETIRIADELGVKYLTLYTFSTENWKRPSREVRFLMKLPEEYLSRELEELRAKNVCIKLMGEANGLPEHTRRAVEEAVIKTEENTGLTVNFAMNYGSRDEVIRAVKKISRLVSEGSLKEEDINEDTISAFLYSGGQPDPDLLIRPSGEQRLSNFLLWQLAYTEFWFTSTYWPDFKKEHFLQAVVDFQKRNRRFGGLTK